MLSGLNYWKVSICCRLIRTLKWHSHIVEQNKSRQLWKSRSLPIADEKTMIWTRSRNFRIHIWVYVNHRFSHHELIRSQQIIQLPKLGIQYKLGQFYLPHSRSAPGTALSCLGPSYLCYLHVICNVSITPLCNIGYVHHKFYSISKRLSLNTFLPTPLSLILNRLYLNIAKHLLHQDSRRQAFCYRNSFIIAQKTILTITVWQHFLHNWGSTTLPSHNPAIQSKHPLLTWKENVNLNQWI